MGIAMRFGVGFVLLLTQDAKVPLASASYSIEGLAAWCGEDPRPPRFESARRLELFARVLYVDGRDPRETIVADEGRLVAMLPNHKQDLLRTFLETQRKRAASGEAPPLLELEVRVALMPPEAFAEVALPIVPRLLKTAEEVRGVATHFEGLELAHTEATIRTWRSETAKPRETQAQVGFHGTVLDYDAERYAILGTIDARGCPSIPIHAIVAPGVTALVVGPELGNAKSVALVTLRKPRTPTESRPASR